MCCFEQYNEEESTSCLYLNKKDFSKKKKKLVKVFFGMKWTRFLGITGFINVQGEGEFQEWKRPGEARWHIFIFTLRPWEQASCKHPFGFVSPLGRFCEDCSPRGGVQGGRGGGLSEHRHHGGEVGVPSPGRVGRGCPLQNSGLLPCLSRHLVLVLLRAGMVICSRGCCEKGRR